MRPSFFILAGLILSATFATALEFSVESAFPLIFSEQPADLTLEGAIVVTAIADAAATLLDDPGWLVQTGPSTWETVFRWDETETRQARFLDAAGDTVTVDLSPAPRMPLDFARHQLPVLHLTTEPANLWDPEIGIYAWGNHENFLQRGEEWERPARLQYFEADGTPVLDEPIGLRINGESSRGGAQKGLRLYFDDHGAGDTVVHDFFGDGPVVCERLVLRAAMFADFAIGSGMAEPLHRELGHPGSRWAYVAVYLNGEYWGAYSLRERFDSKWVETTHDWADDDYVIVKDHDAEEGDYQRWLDVLDGAVVGDPASHEWFQWLDAQLDITSYLDWLLINTSMMTADNMHGKNLAILKIGGDRFRFMTWDEDILFQSGNLNADHLSFYTATSWSEWHEHEPPVWFSGGPYEFIYPWNTLLDRSLDNAQFKARLRGRADALLDGALSIRSLTERLDALAVIQEPEWEHHEVRWEPPNSYQGRILTFRGLIAQRHSRMADLVAGVLADHAQPVELSAFTVTPGGAAGHTLDWHTEREADCQTLVIQRRDGDGAAPFVDLAELPAVGGPDQPADYTHVDQDAPAGVDVAYRLAYRDTGGSLHVLDWIESLALPALFNLRLNEFMADNDGTIADEAGEFDDWLELTNIGPESVALAGLFLTDNLDNPTKWALPAGELAPGAYLLIWCDEDLDQGPWHASFKLSAGGEELGLFAGFEHGHEVIDSVVFGAQATDVALGRQPDGVGDWVVCDPATPGQANTPVTAAAAGLIRPWLAPASPNPFNPATTIRFIVPRRGDVTLRVFDVAGRLVRTLADGPRGAGRHEVTWDGRDGAGRSVASGAYYYRIDTNGYSDTRKMTLVK